MSLSYSHTCVIEGLITQPARKESIIIFILKRMSVCCIQEKSSVFILVSNIWSTVSPQVPNFVWVIRLPAAGNNSSMFGSYSTLSAAWMLDSLFHGREGLRLKSRFFRTGWEPLHHKPITLFAWWCSDKAVWEFGIRNVTFGLNYINSDIRMYPVAATGWAVMIRKSSRYVQHQITAKHVRKKSKQIMKLKRIFSDSKVANYQLFQHRNMIF